MRLTVKGVEHVFDDNGVCQIHGGYCSMAGADPEDYGRTRPKEAPLAGQTLAELKEAITDAIREEVQVQTYSDGEEYGTDYELDGIDEAADRIVALLQAHVAEK